MIDELLPNQYLTIEQVAQVLQLQPETVRTMAREKRIPAIKIGRVWRFKASKIAKWVDQKGCEL